jgi:23S rRNA (adenine2503-C2)-methyltransferase
MIPQKNIRYLDVDGLKEIVSGASEPAFRAKQLYEWIWKKAASSFDEMQNLPLAFREYLKSNFSLNIPSVEKMLESSDGSIKFLLRLHDDHCIESVLMPSKSRVSLCISTQVGCRFACRFCATGSIGYKRDLEFYEIFDQVAILNKESIVRYEKKITNIVFMGMGEPLNNYENLVKAMKMISSPQSLGISTRRMTVSTVGLAEGIRKLANEKTNEHLALSLNTAINSKRTRIMPVNKSNGLNKLKEALKYYYGNKREMITLEYIVFDDFNNTEEDAIALKEFLSGLPAKINIIA